MNSKLLIVVDYQKDFVDGALGSKYAAKIEDKLYGKVEKYLKEGNRVIFTKDTHYPDTYANTIEGKKLPIEHCFKDQDGWMLYGKLGIFDHERSNEVEIYGKETFGFKNIASAINERYDEIEICGVVTNICVISNVVLVKTFFPQTEVIVDASCCASNDKKLHYKALDVMKSFQVKIINDKRDEINVLH